MRYSADGLHAEFGAPFTLLQLERITQLAPRLPQNGPATTSVEASTATSSHNRPVAM
jgi:hypothetical protein